MNLSRNATYALLLGLLGLVLLAMYLTLEKRTPRDRPSDPGRWSPVETLEAFVEAQESGDRARVAQFIANASRPAFEATLAQLDSDDLVTSSLQFREERYHLEEVTPTQATFYSPVSALYLVMQREENRWRIDPFRTDILNKESK